MPVQKSMLVESTFIERRQQHLGRIGNFPVPVTFSVFDLEHHEVPQIKSQTMRHPLMNLLTQLYLKNLETHN